MDTYEYVWLGGKNTYEDFHSRVLDSEVKDLTVYDAEGRELLLKPTSSFVHPFLPNALLTYCECYDGDEDQGPLGWREQFDQTSPPRSEDPGLYFTLEQQYVVRDWKTKQDIYDLMMEHFTLCKQYGVSLHGCSRSSSPFQSSFELHPLPGILAGDHLIHARFILARLAERHNCTISYEGKCVITVSTRAMRDRPLGSKFDYAPLLRSLRHHHSGAQAAYGTSGSEFTCGVGTNKTSVSVPTRTTSAYLIDRRAPATIDPYLALMSLSFWLTQNV